MSRFEVGSRSAALVVLGVAGLIVPATAQAAADAARPRNILFLFADDMRPDCIAALGNEHIRTPTLDGLVQRGFSFRRNYCMGSRHGAVCMPSRAMIMSGRYLPRVRDDLQGVRTLPAKLAGAGYRTWMTGKWHNGKVALERSFQQARSVLLGGMSDHHQVPLSDLDPAARTFGPRQFGKRHSSEMFADTAIEFLRAEAGRRKAGTAKPFFGYVAFTAPHDPRDPPVSHRDLYREQRPPLPPNFRPQHGLAFDVGALTTRDERLAAWPREPDVVRDQLAEYYALITHLDEQIARVLGVLRELGLAQDTLIVFAADHGLAVGSHGLLGKQSLYEHSMGCPLVLAGAGVEHGTSTALTYLLDLHPTLLAVAGLHPEEEVDGQSLWPLLAGQRPPRSSLFTIYSNNQRAIRNERYKLMRFPKIDRTLLFDLQADPHETKNLFGQPEYAATAKELRADLVRWQAETGDDLPWTAATVLPATVDLSGRPRQPDHWQPRWIVDKYFR